MCLPFRRNHITKPKQTTNENLTLCQLDIASQILSFLDDQDNVIHCSHVSSSWREAIKQTRENSNRNFENMKNYEHKSVSLKKLGDIPIMFNGLAIYGKSHTLSEEEWEMVLQNGITKVSLFVPLDAFLIHNYYNIFRLSSVYNLKELSLGNYNLNDKIVKQILQQFPKLSRIELRRSGFKDEHISHLTALPQLSCFIMSGSPLGSVGKDAIFNGSILYNLRELNIYCLTYSIPQFTSKNLPNLRYLALDASYWRQEDYDHVFKCECQLTALELINSSIKSWEHFQFTELVNLKAGTETEHVQLFDGLEKLDLSVGKTVDCKRLFRKMANLQKVEELTLHFGSSKPEAFVVLAQHLTNLEKLTLFSQHFSDEHRKMVENCFAGKKINLKGCSKSPPVETSYYSYNSAPRRLNYRPYYGGAALALSVR